MGRLIKFPIKPKPFVPGKSAIPDEFFDLVREWQDHKDPRVRTLVKGILVMMDALDTIELTGVMAAIDEGVEDDPSSGLVQIVTYVQGILHREIDS